MKEMRTDIKKHEEVAKSHLPTALEKIVKLEATISVDMYTLKREKYISFNLPGYSKKMM